MFVCVCVCVRACVWVSEWVSGLVWVGVGECETTSSNIYKTKNCTHTSTEIFSTVASARRFDNKVCHSNSVSRDNTAHTEWLLCTHILLYMCVERSPYLRRNHNVHSNVMGVVAAGNAHCTGTGTACVAIAVKRLGEKQDVNNETYMYTTAHACTRTQQHREVKTN